MGRPNRDDKLRKKVSSTSKRKFEPEIFISEESDFASIKLSPGVEARSYMKDGFVFLEDKSGKVIEIQVLNLSELAKRKQDPAA